MQLHDNFAAASFRIQVLSNSGIATVLVIIVWKLTEGKDKCLNSKDSTLITSLIGGIIGHYCCCNGDTWSSELGILSDDQPRLITTFKVNDHLASHCMDGFLHILLFVLLNFNTNSWLLACSERYKWWCDKGRTSSSCSCRKCHWAVVRSSGIFNNQM